MGAHRLGTEKGGESLFSIREAAEFLNVSASFVAARIESGRLPVRNAGSVSLIRVEELRAFRATLGQETEAALKSLAEAGQELGI